jgi:hypothetical protein
VAIAVRGNDAFGAQEEDKAFEQGFIGGQADGLEAFVGLLVGSRSRGATRFP